jgi:hypothetical protein
LKFSKCNSNSRPFLAESFDVFKFRALKNKVDWRGEYLVTSK